MSGKIGAVILALLMIIALVCCAICIERVPAGYVGVVYNMSGGVVGETIGQGWHIVPPYKDVTMYSISIEQSYMTAGKKGDSPNDESFKTPSSDGKMITVELEFSYHFDPSRVADTYIMFKGQSGVDIKNSYIKPKVYAWTQEVTAQYPVTDIFGDKRTEINDAVFAHLRAKFDEYGIIMDSVNFTDIDVDDETKAAIQRKVTAQQEMELANIEAKTAKIQAEKDKQVAQVLAEQRVIEANAKAEAMLISANAEADALRINAEAKAEANKLINASLSPELLEMIKYEQWNGQLPTVTGGGATIVDIAP